MDILSTHLVTSLILAVLGLLSWMIRVVTAAAMQLSRERSALELAPEVYRSGGDAAAVLRALQSSQRRGDKESECDS